MPTPTPGVTIQELPDPRETGSVLSNASRAFLWQIYAAREDCPPYWSVYRDNWLQDFVKKPGNDILAGAISTLVGKVVATSFYIEGPLSLVLLYRQAILRMGFGNGYDIEMPKWVESYLTRDAGANMECLRASATDREGPALGFAHLDESKCIPTGNPEYPIIYVRAKKTNVKVHRSQVLRLIDMPESRDVYKSVGFCSTSRALATAQILLELVRYKRERLSDLPPAAILLINNMTPEQWVDVLDRYDAKQYNKGNKTWRNLLVAFGLDPIYELKATMFPFSELPEHYNERDATEMAVYSFALALRMDPRDLWPVSAGMLGGSAMESEVQHRKAKAKGEGILFSLIERQLNGEFGLPNSVKFHFDFRDSEEDLLEAQVKGVKIQNIRRMWEASPNMMTGGVRATGSDEGTEDTEPAEPEEASEVLPGMQGIGMITTEEARQLLIHENVVPPEILGQTMNVERIYDVRKFPPWLYGPRSRVYRDGQVIIFGRAA